MMGYVPAGCLRPRRAQWSAAQYIDVLAVDQPANRGGKGGVV